MKNPNRYYKIKWGSFFATVIILGAGVFGAMMLRGGYSSPENPPEQQAEPKPESNNGHYSNADFGHLIEENLSDLGFIEDLTFKGKSEGRFSITGTLSNPSRLTAICPDLQSIDSILSSLKGERITINGHLGESDTGNGQFVSDTVAFSGLTLPAGIATNYIDQYTSLNSLLEVPIHQIEMNENGVYFNDEIPTAIQIASYNPPGSSPSAENKPT